MKWLEIIKIRTFVEHRQIVAPELLKTVAAGLDAPGLVESAIYDHVSIPGDLSITLLWNTDQPECRGSEAALRLIQELRNSGLVDHSIWVERIS